MSITFNLTVKNMPASTKSWLPTFFPADHSTPFTPSRTLDKTKSASITITSAINSIEASVSLFAYLDDIGTTSPQALLASNTMGGSGVNYLIENGKSYTADWAASTFTASQDFANILSSIVPLMMVMMMMSMMSSAMGGLDVGGPSEVTKYVDQYGNPMSKKEADRILNSYQGEVQNYYPEQYQQPAQQQQLLLPQPPAAGTIVINVGRGAQ